MVISFGLEAPLHIMALELFWKIIKWDFAGLKDLEKAQKIRIFLIPDEFIGKGIGNTPKDNPHLAAFISERYDIVLYNFCSFACMYVESRFIPWTKKDFEVGTEVWNNLILIDLWGLDEYKLIGISHLSPEIFVLKI